MAPILLTDANFQCSKFYRFHSLVFGLVVLVLRINVANRQGTVGPSRVFLRVCDRAVKMCMFWRSVCSYILIESRFLRTRLVSILVGESLKTKFLFYIEKHKKIVTNVVTI